MDIELLEQINEKLGDIKEEYIVKMLTMQFYASFLMKYKHVVEQDGEEIITNFLYKHINLLIEQKEDNPADLEFQDHYIAYVAAIIYDFEIINDEAIADFVMRRYMEYKVINLEQGISEEEAWKNCFIKEYETPEHLLENMGLLYKEITPRIYRDAVKFLLNNLEYFELCSPLNQDLIIELIKTLFTPKNKRFTALFHTEIPQVLIKIEGEYKLSVPNLVMACIELFIEYQQERIIVNS